MKQLTIDRGQWMTGTANKILEGGQLYHERTGLMCCLGFYGRTCGLSTSVMAGLGRLEGFKVPEAAWLQTPITDPKERTRFKLNVLMNPTVEDALIRVNDRTHGIHPTRREAAIKYLFKKYGNIDVTFTGSYAEATKKAKAR